MDSFLQINDLHRDLCERFIEHQSALLHFDFRVALERLRRYESALLAHMRDEEELLLPLYRERAVPERGGATDLFLLEHAKLRRHLAHFAEQLPRLQYLPDPTRAVIKLLEQETTFKHLVEHHDTREEKFLYPALERHTSPAEKADLLARLSR